MGDIADDHYDMAIQQYIELENEIEIIINKH